MMLAMQTPARHLPKAGMLLAFAGTLCMALASNACAESRHYTVIIEGMQFTPSALEIKKGDTVEWVNKDIFPHNATADNHRFTSVDIAPGKSWKWKALKPGKITYLCTLHPTMKAVLIVK